jgi:hypothetical protein
MQALRDAGVPIMRIGNLDVPLYGIPGVPVWALLNLLLTLLALIVAVMVVKERLQARRKEFSESGDLKGAALWSRRGIIVLGAAALIAFFLTEDLRAVMAIVDSWTWLMALIAAAQLALLLVAYGKRGRPRRLDVAGEPSPAAGE